MDPFPAPTAGAALVPEKTPRLRVPGGILEALKWLALVLMTMDHVNKVLFDLALPGFFEAGRVAMPLFGFVLGCNMARPDALASGMVFRTMKRLVLSGLCAMPFFVALRMSQANWLPLNIMFTLLLATATIWLLRRGTIAENLAALVLFGTGSAFVEFTWFGVAYCVAAWRYCSAPTVFSLLAWLATAVMLYFINHNFWAAAAVPVVLLAARLPLRVPRVRYAFYVYYPAHLAALLLLRLFWWQGT